MNQDKIHEATKRAIEAPLAFTHSVMEKSKQLSTPSPKVDEIGMKVGRGAGVGLVVIGLILLIVNRPLWAAGSLLAGIVTIVSNILRWKWSQRNK